MLACLVDVSHDAMTIVHFHLVTDLVCALYRLVRTGSGSLQTDIVGSPGIAGKGRRPFRRNYALMIPIPCCRPGISGLGILGRSPVIVAFRKLSAIMVGNGSIELVDIVQDFSHLVDSRKIPAGTLVIAPFLCREIRH